MKYHPQNISNKPKRGEQNYPNKKRGSFSQNEGSNESKKKINSSPQKSNELKKDNYKHDKNNNISNFQQLDIKENNHKMINNNNLK